jgi:AcrR family transcriptional regulator
MATDRRDQILKEATRLFSRFGYDKVTIKELAASCGITEPALYRYFASKEAIYGAVLDSLKSFLDYQPLFERLKGEKSVKIIMHEMARHILNFLKSHRELYRLMLYSALGEHRKARQVFRSVRNPYVDFLKDKLDELYRQGLIRKKNNHITACCFVGMVFDCALSATLWKGFQGKSHTPKEVIGNNVPIFIDGLRNQGLRKKIMTLKRC